MTAVNNYPTIGTPGLHNFPYLAINGRGEETIVYAATMVKAVATYHMVHDYEPYLIRLMEDNGGR